MLKKLKQFTLQLTLIVNKDFSDLRFENPDSARETLSMMGEYED